MKKILIDTDTIIDFLRGSENAKKFFKAIQEEDYLVYFSSITEAELIRGRECKKIEKRAEIITLLSYFTKINVNNEISVKAGDFSREYDVDLPDAIIAATAYVMKADLISRNIKDYRRISEITIKVPY